MGKCSYLWNMWLYPNRERSPSPHRFVFYKTTSNQLVHSEIPLVDFSPDQFFFFFFLITQHNFGASTKIAVKNDLIRIEGTSLY